MFLLGYWPWAAGILSWIFCFDLTFPECQKSGNGIGQYPGVSTELKQVIWENVGKSEAEPVKKKN